MMNTRFYLLIACVALIFVSCARKPFAVQGHYYAMEGYRPVVLPGTKTVAENPFPLSAYEKEKLLDSVAYVCRTYLEKYSDHNLDTWSKPDCEAYLRAKSTQIILQFQPDYYRAYAVPEIRRYAHDFMGPYFLLTYYYDRTKESNGSPLDLKFKAELVHVAINAGDAQGRYLSLPILNVDDGSVGSVDNIRIGLYVDRKWIPYPYMIWNKDFDWDSIVLFE